MKRFLINGRFLSKQITGVERYAFEVLRELDKVATRGSLSIAIPNNLSNVPQYENIECISVGTLHNVLWEHFSFPIYSLKKGYIPLSLCNVAPLLYPGVVCLHDAMVRAIPDNFGLRFRLWYNLLFWNATKRSSQIITVSEFSKKEIAKYYKVSPNKIVVAYNAWQHYQRIKPDESVLTRHKLREGEYYFALGSLKPNKNLQWVAQVARNNTDSEFIVAGVFNERVFSRYFDFDYPDNVRIIGYVTDEEAKALSRHCSAFLFPSLYEGFGIPPLEAIAAGARRVIVSDIEVMHEVFSNSVIYINPMKYTYQIEELQPVNGRDEILTKYSWEKTAQQILNLIESA